MTKATFLNGQTGDLECYLLSTNTLQLLIKKILTNFPTTYFTMQS